MSLHANLGNGFLLPEIQGNVAQNREVLGGVLLPNATLVFPEGYIQSPVKSIFDAPLDLCGGPYWPGLRETSQVVAGFDTPADAQACIGQLRVPILIDRLRQGTGLERARAAKALLAILDARSIPALIAALDDDSPVVEHYASEALTRLSVGTVLIKPL